MVAECAESETRVVSSTASSSERLQDNNHGQWSDGCLIDSFFMMGKVALSNCNSAVDPGFSADA